MSSEYPKPTDDGLMRLSAAASAAERRNKPTWLVVVAAVFLGVAVLYAALGFFARASAAGEQHRAVRRFAGVKLAIDAIDAAVAERDAAAATGGNVPVALEQLARRVNPPLTVSVSSSSRGQAAGNSADLQRFEFNANIQNADPISILEWLGMAMDSDVEDLHGLQVESISITPGRSEVAAPGRWNATVQFIRWQTEGTTR